MAVSNASGSIVLTTGNKSEMATGYSTLYGDSAGGFAVIKDVPKTLVYELCRYRNDRAADAGQPEPIPGAVLEKPPSAELRPDQRDDQSLPPYDLLDPVLEAYVERDRTAADLVADGFDPAVVDRVVRLVDGAEYKRRQMPPGVRITTKAFGKDRRMPITNRYRPAHRPVGPEPVSQPSRSSRSARAAVERSSRWLSRSSRSRPAHRPDGDAARRLPLGGAPAVRADRGLGGRAVAPRRPGPPGRGERAARLARRALGRPPAGAGLVRPRRR